MKASTPAPVAPRPFFDFSVSVFVAMMTGYTSSLVLMFQAGKAAHLTDAQISSWIWALSIGMALCTIGLSLRYRAPIVIAWSTPGAALLISSLPNVAYSDAIGAFILCAVLMTAVGFTGWFDTLMKRIPSGIAAALLAGILFEISIEIFRAAEHRTALVVAMFLTYVPHLSRGQALRAALCDARDAARGHRDGERPRPARFFGLSRRARASGLHHADLLRRRGGQHRRAALRRSTGVAKRAGHRRAARRGYTAPSAPLISATGLASLALAPFGSHGVNLAAITAAICTGREAHEDRDRRYTAAVWCGVFYLIAGVFGSIMSGLANAMHDVRQREPALVTFMVTASGFTLMSISPAFWGLIAGLLTHFVLNARRA